MPTAISRGCFCSNCSYGISIISRSKPPFKHPWSSIAIESSETLSWKDRENTNLLLTEREGRTGEYWPEVVAVRTERSEVRTKTSEGQYSPVRLELARLVSSLLYGTRSMLVLMLPAFENKKYTAYDRFHGNGPYGEKNQSERLDLPCHIINTV